MIYLTAGGKHIVILEPDNLERLKGGKPATTPDKEIFIAYTPDAEWTGEKIKASMEGHSMDPDALDRILAEGLSRPEVRGRPYKMEEHFTGKTKLMG